MTVPKCASCRQDKTKCLPVNRQWPTKCKRCIAKNRECSENNGTKRTQQKTAQRLIQAGTRSLLRNGEEDLARPEQDLALGELTVLPQPSSNFQSPFRIRRPSEIPGDSLLWMEPYLLDEPTSTISLDALHGQSAVTLEMDDALPFNDTFQLIGPFQPNDFSDMDYDIFRQSTPIDEQHSWGLNNTAEHSWHCASRYRSPPVSVRLAHRPIAGYLAKLPQIEFGMPRMHQLSRISRQSIPSLLPSELERSLATRTLGTAIMHTSMYLLINNHVHVGWGSIYQSDNDTKLETVKMFLSYLQQKQPSMIRKIGSSIPAPYRMALWTNLIDLAIGAGALRVVEEILEEFTAASPLVLRDITNLVSNSSLATVKVVFCGLLSGKIQTLQYYERGDFEKKQEYLASQMVPKSPFYVTEDRLSQQDITSVFTSRNKGTSSAVLIETFDILCKLTDPLKSLNFFLELGGEEIFQRLFKAAPEPKCESMRYFVVTGGGARIISRIFSEDESERAFQKLLSILPRNQVPEEMRFQSKVCINCRPLSFHTTHTSEDIHMHLSSALCVAISRRHWKVVNVLLRGGVLPLACCLINAVNVDNTEIKQQLLSASPVVDVGAAPSHDLEESMREQSPFYIPSAEVTRRKNHDALRIFNRNESGEFTDAANMLSCFVAACEVSNKFVITRCLDNMRILMYTKSYQHFSHHKALHDCLSQAITNQDEPLITLLFEHGARIGLVELLCAMTTRHRPVVEKIFEYQDYIQLTNGELREYGPKILIEVVQWGDVSLLDRLLQHGIYKSFTQEALVEAVRSRKSTMVDMLLNAGLSLSPHCGKILKAVVTLNDPVELQTWLSRGLDPSHIYYGALEMAIKSRNLEIIEILLSNVNIRYPGGNGTYCLAELELAIRLKAIDIVRLLTHHLNHNRVPGRNVGEMNDWPGFGKALAVAISIDGCESLEMTRILLEKGVSANEVFYLDYDLGQHRLVPLEGSQTAFLVAIKKGCREKVDLLLQKANVNQPAKMGLTRTPLQLAVEEGNPDMVSLLLSSGATPNSPASASGGATALQLAAIGGHVEIAKILLRYDGDLNAPPALQHGRTPFEGAAEHGRLDMMTFLINHGVLDGTDAGEQIRRALYFADSNNQFGSKQYIEEIGKELGVETKGMLETEAGTIA